MSITGYLVEFSLPELFQFLDQGQKTGLLKLSFNLDTASQQPQEHYIWFRQGRIVAASPVSDGSGLISIIKQKGLFKPEMITYNENLNVTQTPLGLSLKMQRFFSAEDLKSLFYTQIMRRVGELFQLQDAYFEFEEDTPLCYSEMTGLSSSGTDLTLAGLRALKNWSALTPKLPEDTSALQNIVEGEPEISINSSEKKVWDLSDGKTTVKAISQQLDMSLDKVKQIGFRLIAIGLAEEIPMVIVVENAHSKLESEIIPEKTSMSSANNGLSSSFLSSLMSFLTEV